MLYNIGAILLFLYLVCIYDSLNTTINARRELKKLNHKESWLTTFSHAFTANNIIYFSIAVPTMIAVVVLAEILKIFFMYY
jgi:hypothetical protein